MELNKIIGNLKSFLIKELDAPCSSSTHLNMVLFSVIEELDSDDLDKVYEAEGEGFYAILEMASLEYKMMGKTIPVKYQRFFDKFEEWSSNLDNLL